MLDPTLATAEAPAEYTVRLKTTEGVVLIDVTRAWAPEGADRFYNLVQSGYYDDTYFFRTIAGFMCQVGLHGDPAVTAAWSESSIPDDPVTQSNTKGMVTFAMAGAHTRTTQIFINLKDNLFLDSQGFAPFGQVRDMRPVEKFWVGYGESKPMGLGPDQMEIMDRGNAYLEAEYPKLDSIIEARVVREG
ncbi:MAG: peptidylprolyl isomerase [Proteobacteria bacterium]|nr:peptidylprolyl isomerase [Pseudomonadota bacterium]